MTIYRGPRASFLLLVSNTNELFTRRYGSDNIESQKEKQVYTSENITSNSGGVNQKGTETWLYKQTLWQLISLDNVESLSLAQYWAYRSIFTFLISVTKYLVESI